MVGGFAAEKRSNQSQGEETTKPRCPALVKHTDCQLTDQSVYMVLPFHSRDWPVR
jgi:hypothetical protein